jgi:cell division septation protein DedD
MPRNDTGEFELVLGNRQLLSLAAIVVVLFGVFFTMGYIVGRNSTPLTQAAADGPPSPAPILNERRPDAVGGGAAEESAPPAEPAPRATQPAQPPAQTEAAQAPPAAQPAPQEAAPPAPQAGQTYLQVAAISRRDAEILVETLRKKGFPALIGPGPNDLFRVLVGPYHDRDALGKGKSDLEAAGFKNSFVPKL